MSCGGVYVVLVPWLWPYCWQHDVWDECASYWGKLWCLAVVFDVVLVPWPSLAMLLKTWSMKHIELCSLLGYGLLFCGGVDVVSVLWPAMLLKNAKYQTHWALLASWVRLVVVFFYVGPLTLVMLLKKKPRTIRLCWLLGSVLCLVVVLMWGAIFPGIVRMFLIIYLVVWFMGILQFCVLLCVQGASQWRLGILPLELKTPVPR